MLQGTSPPYTPHSFPYKRCGIGVNDIEKTLFKFIWKFSKREQFILLVVTTALFPFLFLTLELPKRIINDAIGARSSQVSVFGFDLAQEYYLWVLCGAFLLSVLVHGLLKMRINTMKGVLSERLLRRLRYSLIARMLRFPKPYFQRTSQGELVAMITGETEPMGGMMGDALAQPVLQAGQMLTILAFLFLQSFWFGMAALALIPLQAWIIPRLQRQINVMNKERIKEVRQLASVIGETATGAGDLRIHGGWRYRLALITDRLGVIYRIRFRIYKKKFFMKFINNFISQLTPFFFFAVGGYLVIQGAVSLGALVAALAAYKDLSAPWKELLTYYNQAQDMSLRWETVLEKFTPSNVLDADLLGPAPENHPDLRGPLELAEVSVTDSDGNLILEKISLTIPHGALVGIAAPSEEDRLALADVLTRELLPIGGTVTFAGHNLMSLHQTTVARRIGLANSKPQLFRGTFGENAMMSMYRPVEETANAAQKLDQLEAIAAGNSDDVLGADWLTSDIEGTPDKATLRTWWMSLIEAIGSDGPMFRRSLDQVVGAQVSQDLARRLVVIRPKVWKALEDANLTKYVYRFETHSYNPALPVTGNLFFAILKSPISQQDLALQSDLFDLLRKLDLEGDLLSISLSVVELLNRIFGTDGTEHPLFRKLGLDPILFEKSVQIMHVSETRGVATLAASDKAILMTLPAQISAEQIGPAFTDQMKQRIIDQRLENKDRFKEALAETYAPLDPGQIVEGLSVLENVLFGKLADGAAGRGDELRRVVSQIIEEEGLKSAVIELIYDLPLGLNGASLPAIFAEPLALIRACIKRPDILVMEQILTSYDQSDRIAVHKNLSKLLPDTTLVYIADSFEHPDIFDVYAEISQGRMRTADAVHQSPEDTAATADLQRKLRALEETDLFSGLDRKQLRLLAFGAKWFHADAGEMIFSKDDEPTDGAYMMLSGVADLFKPTADGEEVITQVGPGTLVGELGLIRRVPRALSMRAATDVKALRLGAEEFLAVVENDAATSFKLLQVIAGYTS